MHVWWLDGCVKLFLQGEGDSTNDYMEDDPQSRVFKSSTKKVLLKLQGEFQIILMLHLRQASSFRLVFGFKDSSEFKINNIFIKYTITLQEEKYAFLAHSHMRKTPMPIFAFLSWEKQLRYNSFLLVFIAVISLRILTYKAPPAGKGFISALPMVLTGLYCALFVLRQFESVLPVRCS